MKTFERFDDIKVLLHQLDSFSELFPGYWSPLKYQTSELKHEKEPRDLIHIMDHTIWTI